MKLEICKVLLNYVADADLHTKLSSVDYSTNVREIVTVGYMIENFEVELIVMKKLHPIISGV